MRNKLIPELVADYPNYEQEIKKLLITDETFREIVEDYMFCKMQLEKLLIIKSVDIANSYSETLKDLKEELTEHLNTALNIKK